MNRAVGRELAVYFKGLTLTSSRSVKMVVAYENLNRNRGGEKYKVTLGIEALCASRLDASKGARVGLVCNQASVDHRLKHSADLLHELPEVNLKTLFGPQHGIRGDVQDNMVETPHAVDAVTGLPVYSLYSKT